MLELNVVTGNRSGPHSCLLFCSFFVPLRRWGNHMQARFAPPHPEGQSSSDYASEWEHEQPLTCFALLGHVGESTLSFVTQRALDSCLYISILLMETHFDSSHSELVLISRHRFWGQFDKTR